MKANRFIFIFAACIMMLSFCASGAAKKVTMYAPDGRTVIVAESSVEDYKKVGWFTDIEDVTVTMYAEDGSTSTVFIADIEQQKQLGWYENKEDVLVTMYSTDGSTKQVYKAFVKQETEAGWHENKEDVAVTMYAVDGRSKEVFMDYVETELSVGWYLEPVCYMYSGDGRRMIVPKAQVSDYKRVGWYETEEETYKWVYSLSSKTQLLLVHVDNWVKLGWSTTPYPIVISASFENNSPNNSCIDLKFNIQNVNADYKAIESVEFDAQYLNANNKPVLDLYGKNYRHIKYDCPPLNWYGSGTANTEFFANVTGCEKICITNIKVTYTDGTNESISGFILAGKAD